MEMKIYKYFCIIQFAFICNCLMLSFSAYIDGYFPIIKYLNIPFNTHPSRYREEQVTVFAYLFEPYLEDTDYKPFSYGVKVEDNLDTIKIHTMIEYAVNSDSILTLVQLTDSTECWLLFSRFNDCSENNVTQNNQIVCKVNLVDDKMIQQFKHSFKHRVGKLNLYEKFWLYVSFWNEHILLIFIYIFLIMIPISLFIHLFLIIMFLVYIKKIIHQSCFLITIFYLIAPFIPELTFFMLKICFGFRT